MKNSFCRICRGRFNLKYPPAAVDSKNSKSVSPRTISIRIAENGEVSENICWDCEETLLGFHKSVSEDNEEEEPVVVDDDEILYKSLEKSKRIHRLSKETEIIQIDSSDSDAEELVIIPFKDDIINVEAARTIGGGHSHEQSGNVNKNNKSVRKTTANKMGGEKEDTIPRGRIFEGKQCPLCPYHSGVEFEVVFHIRQTHPQYIGDDLRFDTKDGDSILTRRIIFAHLWTFFECKECGKIYDRFWPHRKHITTHDRNKLKSHHKCNNPEVSAIPPKLTTNTNTAKNLKRPLDESNASHTSTTLERVKIIKTSNIQQPQCKSNEKKKTLVVKLLKSESKTASLNKQQSQSEKSKSKALIRKQQQLAARREKRLRKRETEKTAAALKAKNKIAAVAIIPKPTFKMPTQPAPRASSITKPTVQKLSFTCKMCSKIFPGFLDWNCHLVRCHSADEFNHKNETLEKICKSCDKHFNDASILQKHVRFSHRRKNKKLIMEVNGNDKDEICCQTQTFKNKECPTEDSSSVKSINQPNVCLLTESALFCQYCGSLLVSETMKAHESRHITDGDVKRFFVTIPKV